MAYSLSDPDREQLAIVRQSLADEVLHVAVWSADRDKLQRCAGELARELALRHGLRVESYQAGRLETIVADLMLQRFDTALSRISAPAHTIRLPAAPGARAGCVLFIPQAQAMPPAELARLVRIAAGAGQLRLVALFNCRCGSETEARLTLLGPNLARWELDEDEASSSMPVLAPHSVTASAATGPDARNVPARKAAGRWPRVAVGTAGLLLALLALLPAQTPPGGAPAAAAQSPSQRGLVQMAGEPPAAFRPAGQPQPRPEDLERAR